VLRVLLDVLSPPACLACRAPVAGGDELCAGCRASLPWIREPCPRCGLPRVGGPCSRCPARRAAFDAAWAPVAHAGPARDLVLALKLRGALGAADAMAAPIAARLAFAGVLVPVPSTPSRRRARGLDPAAALAAAVARRTGRDVARCLVRDAGDRRQVGRSRAARRRDGGSFVVDGDAPEAVVLLDDVHTTGATLDACARALRGVGTRRITAVTYARTLMRA
jgi:predicted amidophosphoribosyltransferase